MVVRKPQLSRYARTIKVPGQIPGQPDEVYTRLPKREYVVRREIFDNEAPDHLAGFSYDEWVEMGSQGGRPKKWPSEAQRKQAERAIQTAQEKLTQGKSLTYQEKELLGLIKKRPGAYKSELGRRMTPAERKRASRARLQAKLSPDQD